MLMNVILCEQTLLHDIFGVYEIGSYFVYFYHLGFLPFVDLNYYCAVNQVSQIFKQQLLIGITVSDLCWFLYKMNKITTC